MDLQPHRSQQGASTMTLEELERAIDIRLSLDKRPIIEFARLGLIADCSPSSWWVLTRHMPPEELPKSLMLAGGSKILQMDEAGPWLKAVVRKHPKKFGVME